MLSVASHAKINWLLRILHRREDGFHGIETIFQIISLHDTLTFTEANELSFRCDDPSIPADETNLVVRAARAMIERGAGAVAIALDKRIPAGGGLGGGSSNAAATLLAMDRIFRLATPQPELARIALSLGSDVPFFLLGGTAYATGRGELLEPLPSPGAIPLLLLFPEERMSTAEAYRMLSEIRSMPDELQQLAKGIGARGVVAGHPAAMPPLGAARCRAIVDGGILAHAPDLENHLEEPVFAHLPHLGDLKRRLIDAGARWSAMSGSGSTIAGAFDTPAARDAAAARFADVRWARTETI